MRRSSFFYSNRLEVRNGLMDPRTHALLLNYFSYIGTDFEGHFCGYI